MLFQVHQLQQYLHNSHESFQLLHLLSTQDMQQSSSHLPGHSSSSPENVQPMSSNRQNKQTTKALKNTPPIDKAGFDIECLRKQLNIAHTKIKEIEAELEKYKTTNHILGERIKLFESANNQYIYEKYFPSKLTTTVKEGQAFTPPHHHHCCLQPPSQTFSCLPTNTTIASDVQELSSKVSQHSSEKCGFQISTKVSCSCC